MSLIKLPTTAAVTFSTAKGSFRVEIWAKETPEISKRFLQNCIDKKYVNKTFNKVIKDYLVQVESLDTDDKVMNEFHSRIKFQQSYLVGAVEKGAKFSTADSFFITLKETPEFNGKYVIFGKVAGDGIYEIKRINSGELQDETPVYPVTITDVTVDIPYFEGLTKTEVAEKPTAIPTKAVKNNKRSKIGMQFEDEEEEEEVDFKMKSAHDVLDDVKLKRRKIKEPKEPMELKEPLKKPAEPEPTEPAEPAETTASAETIAPETIAPVGEETKSAEKVSVGKSPQPAPKRPRRDPIVDDGYNSALDISDSDDVEVSKLQQHKLVCR